jgi:hypothetical protein
MTPADQKKRFRAFAKQLENGTPPSERQTHDLISIFRGISEGRDPARILGIVYGDGKSKQDENARAVMDLVMHWIACATEADIDQNGNPIKPYSMVRAFQEGSKIARTLSGTVDPDAYDPSYIKKVWYERKKQGKVSTVRSASDPDSIYEYTVPDPKE